MKDFKPYLLIGVLTLLCSNLSIAQLEVTSLGQTISVDFDSPTPGVCDGPIQGTGFSPNPAPGSGHIDSDAISFSGLVSPPDMPFGGTATTGDAAKGVANNANNGGGFYAFDPSTPFFTPADGLAFGFAPSVSHFNPGSVTLKFTNSTGFAINEFEIGLSLYIRNNSDRSTSFSVEISVDNGATFIGQDQSFSTSLIDDNAAGITFWVGPSTPGAGELLSISQQVCSPIPLQNNQSILMRVNIVDDGVGTDTEGDLLAFDDIEFTASDRAFCPAVDVTNVAVNDNSNNTASTITWTNPSGCFDATRDAVIVVAREGSDVTSNVSDLDGIRQSSIDDATNVEMDWSARSTDNEVFTVTQNIAGTAGEDYIVYKGTGTSTTVTNLDPDKTYYFRVLTISSGCDWSTGESSQQTLATELIDFQAIKSNKKVQLNWTASHDNQHSHIIVEHSQNGFQYENLASIASKATVGQIAQYNYVDNTPYAGNNYYRLNMINLDGTQTYSPVQVINMQNTTNIQVAAVVAEGRLNILNQTEWKDETYAIYRTNGTLVKTGMMSNSIENLQLATGIYYLKISNQTAIAFKW